MVSLSTWEDRTTIDVEKTSSVDQADLKLRDPPASASASQVLALKVFATTTTQLLCGTHSVDQVGFELTELRLPELV